MYPALFKLGVSLLLMGAALLSVPSAKAAVITAPCSVDCTTDSGKEAAALTHCTNTGGTNCRTFTSARAYESAAGCTPGQLFPGIVAGEAGSFTASSFACNNTVWALVNTYRVAAVCPNDNAPVEGIVDRVAPYASSPPQQVCNAGCTYTLDRATNVVGPNNAPQWLGTWRRDGGTCSSQPDPTNPPDTSPDSTDATKVTEGMGDVDKALTPEVGPMLAFPSLPFFSAPVSRVCSVAVSLPPSFFGSSGFVVDMCPYLDKIDSIGGWLLYFFTALGLWGLFVARPQG